MIYIGFGEVFRMLPERNGLEIYVQDKEIA